jgi:hypothetical protein
LIEKQADSTNEKEARGKVLGRSGLDGMLNLYYREAAWTMAMAFRTARFTVL